MAVKFKDYYETLGVTRTAAQNEIKAAYRKLARKLHPDVNKAKDAEDRFKEIGEAYEVLSDPEKRRKYDELGSNWRNGDDFQPPPGWARAGASGGMGGGGTSFSDFFDSIFGRNFRGFGGRGQAEDEDTSGQDREVRVRIPLEDAFNGAERTISLQMQERFPDGRLKNLTKDIKVKIPAGVITGQKIRLAGQGGKGQGRGGSGDLYLQVELEPHERFRVAGRDLHTDLPIAPWEAALGATITLPILSGDVSMVIPPGTSSGQKMRLKGKGMPNPSGTPGDLYAEIRITVPKTLTPAEREMWEKLKNASHYNPRADW